VDSTLSTELPETLSRLPCRSHIAVVYMLSCYYGDTLRQYLAT
jgi:hypothetical protein